MNITRDLLSLFFVCAIIMFCKSSFAQEGTYVRTIEGKVMLLETEVLNDTLYVLKTVAVNNKVPKNEIAPLVIISNSIDDMIYENGEVVGFKYSNDNSWKFYATEISEIENQTEPKASKKVSQIVVVSKYVEYNGKLYGPKK